MAKNTTWKDIATIPTDQLVIVWSAFYGCKLRSKTDSGDWYDDNEFFDDAETEWDLWTELPMLPGRKVGKIEA